MRVLFSVRPFHGHFHPMMPLVTGLEAAGHEVAVATSEEIGDLVAGSGAGWFPAGIHPTVAERLWPDSGADYGYETVACKTRDLLEVMVGAFRPDVVIRDPTDLAPVVAADAVGVPCAVFGFSRFIPRSSWWVLGGRETLERLRAEYGLRPDPRLDRAYNGLYIDVVPPSFETRRALPLPRRQRLRYEAWDGGDPSKPPEWLDELDGRPTVLVTLGTVYNDRPDLFDTFLEAVAGEDVNVVCTLGPGVDPSSLSVPADHVRLERYLPHSLVLPRCSLLVCHGGFNTVMGALCESVPVLCVPLGSDQEFNAARCEALGAGLWLEDEQASVESVGASVRRILEEESFAQGAARVREEIESLPSVAASVERLEAFAGRPAGRAG